MVSRAILKCYKKKKEGCMARKEAREGGREGGRARTDPLELLLEPVNGILLRHSMRSPHTPHLELPTPDTEALAA